MEIVGILMNDDGPADDVLDEEPPSKYGEKGTAIGRQQGRQVPGVVGVLCFARIEMAQGIGKAGAAAATARVDVESEEPVGQALDLRDYQGTASLRVEPDLAPDMGRVYTAQNVCHGGGTGTWIVTHDITS